MFTKDMNGHKAGEVEYPEVTETADGLTFTVTGLSPITIGWVDADGEDSTGEGGAGNTPSGGNGSGGVENAPSDDNVSSDSVTNVVLTSPATGDNANVVLWCLIMLGCAAVAVAALKKRNQ